LPDARFNTPAEFDKALQQSKVHKVKVADEFDGNTFEIKKIIKKREQQAQ